MQLLLPVSVRVLSRRPKAGHTAAISLPAKKERQRLRTLFSRIVGFYPVTTGCPVCANLVWFDLGSRRQVRASLNGGFARDQGVAGGVLVHPSQELRDGQTNDPPCDYVRLVCIVKHNSPGRSSGIVGQEALQVSQVVRGDPLCGLDLDRQKP